MGHVWTGTLDFQQFSFFLSHFGAIKVRRLSLTSTSSRFCVPTAVSKISLVFVLLKKMKRVYRIFFVTQCISDACFVLFCVCDLRCFDVVLCPPRAKSWRRHCLAHWRQLSAGDYCRSTSTTTMRTRLTCSALHSPARLCSSSSSSEDRASSSVWTLASHSPHSSSRST